MGPPQGFLGGFVYDEQGLPVEGARITIVYDVCDLLVERPAATPAPETGLHVAREIEDQLTKGPPPTREERLEVLAATMRVLVGPHHWRVHGGRFGSIHQLNGHLIITTTGPNHEAIVDMLDGLRALTAVSVLASMEIVQVGAASLAERNVQRLGESPVQEKLTQQVGGHRLPFGHPLDLGHEAGEGTLLELVQQGGVVFLRFSHHNSLLSFFSPSTGCVETTREDRYTQPVGFGRPATLQAPFAGPLGNSS